MAGPQPTARFFLKRGDTLPTLVCKLRESPNVAMDLTGVTSVRLTIQEVDTAENVIADVNMTLDDAPDARYLFPWPVGGLPRSGQYQAVVRILWANNQRQTLPTNGYVTITVEDDLS